MSDAAVMPGDIAILGVYLETRKVSREPLVCPRKPAEPENPTSRIAVLGQMRQTAYLSQRGYTAVGLIARID
jgi:hypothetical protein